VVGLDGQALFTLSQGFMSGIERATSWPSEKTTAGSQEDLAERSGTHWTFVGQVERGQRNLSLRNLLKLAAGVDVDACELVRGLT
jgi:transcriptional regulator with XRE-family HTH domain